MVFFLTTSDIYGLFALGFLLYVLLFVLIPAMITWLGNSFIKAKKPGRAAALYTFMLKVYPRSSSFYVMRSQAYLELQEYQRTIQDCNKAISLKPKLPTPYSNRGVAHSKLYQYELALQDFNHAIEIFPSFVQAYINRAALLYLLRQYQEALQDLDHAFAISPNININFGPAYYTRGLVYLKKKEYQLALQDFDRALMQNPKAALYYNGRGRANKHLRDYQRALQDFERAIVLAPMNAMGYHNRGDTYLCLDNIMQAKADFHKSQGLDPKSILHRWMSELCTLCFESPDEGMPERLEKLASLDIHPRDQYYYLVHGSRGWAHWLRGHFEEALTEFEQAILITPYGDIYIWVGMACAALSRDEEAKAALEYARKDGVPDYMFKMLKLLEKTRPDFLQQYGSLYLQEQVTAQIDA